MYLTKKITNEFDKQHDAVLALCAIISASLLCAMLKAGVSLFTPASAIMLIGLLATWTLHLYQLQNRTVAATRAQEISQAAAPAPAPEPDSKLMAEMFTQMHMAVLVTRLKDDKTHYISRAFERLTSTSEQAFTDHPDQWKNLIHPEDRAQVLRTAKRAGSENTATEMPFRIQLASGARRWVHGKWFRVQEYTNGPLLLACALTDITENHRTDSTQKHEDLLCRSIIEKLPFPIFLKDDHLRYIACNHQLADVYGTTPRGIVNKTNFDLVPLDVADVLQEREMKILQTGLASTTQDTFTINDEERMLKTYAIPIKENGQVTKVLGYTTDITESHVLEQQQKDLNAQLSRARRLESVGKLAGEVAHDLNNILGPVVAYPDLILEELGEHHPVAEDVEAIKHAALNAADIIGDLLSLSRKNNYKLTPLDMNSTLNDFLQSPTIKVLQEANPDINIDLRLEEDMLPVMATPTNLNQVIMNLVLNAADALHGKGTISIETELLSVAHRSNRFDPIEAGEYIALTIRDTGEGIPAEQIETIFEPFFTTKKGQGKGTGLGLSIVYGIVKDFSGYIDVQSKPGEGTTFTLYFPPTLEEISSDEAHSEDNRGTESILVVDDTRAQRDLARRMLERLGYKVTCAHNGHGAVQKVLRHTYEFVLTDMVMEEGYDGLDTLIDIRKMYPEMPVIIASGYADNERAQKAMKTGVSDFISKPYLIDRLGSSVRKSLDGAMIKRAETLMNPPT